jgi:hypothetical protein
MATKIGFDPSLATPGVDWSVVTTSVIKGLNDLEARRDKARKDVDTKTREEVDVLRNVEMGKDAQVNEFVMNAREQLTETSLMDKRLWENGILSTKDFLRNNNNRTTGTASLINSFKTYNADYDRIVKGVEDKTLSRITLNRKAQVEKLFDMRTHAFVVNPTTGEPNIVKRDANGAPSSDPNDIVNSSVVDFLSTADVKYFNAQTTAKGIVDSLGQRLIRDGLGKTTKGAYLALDSAGEAAKAQLKSAREEAIDVALMGSNMASFLVDSGDYDTTTNKDEADKNDKLILENPDGTFEYDEKQKTEAKLRFENLLESMIPRSEEAALPKTPSATERKAASNLAVNTDLATTLVDIITGNDPAKVQADLGILPEYDLGTRGVRKTPQGINLELYNPKTKKFEDTPIIFTDRTDVRGAVKRSLQKLLGRRVNVEQILDNLPEGIFEGKTISDVEALYKAPEIVNIEDVDNNLNVIADPTVMQDITNPTFISIDDLITKIEDEDVEEEDYAKTIKEILKKQGLTDVNVTVVEEDVIVRDRYGVEKVSPTRVQNITIESEFLDEPTTLRARELPEKIREIVLKATDQRRAGQTFNSTGGSANRRGELDD